LLESYPAKKDKNRAKTNNLPSFSQEKGGICFFYNDLKMIYLRKRKMGL